VFNAKPHDRQFLFGEGHQFQFFKQRLSPKSVSLAKGFDAVSPFVNDQLDEFVIKTLKAQGVKVILLRTVGYNNVDLQAAKEQGIKVYRVPVYSPNAVAEYAVGLMLTLNRKIHKAYNRVRDSNFSLDGLMGFDMNQKTVGIIGTGAIGSIAARILKGFNCKLLAYDIIRNEDLVKSAGVQYVELDKLLAESDIITLHASLSKDTFHMINEETIQKMKSRVMLINTSRGGLVDTRAAIKALKSGHIQALGMDVYEHEQDIFFKDFSAQILTDDTLARLLSFPNVIVTSHQAFFTREAMENITKGTLQNIEDFLSARDTNELTKTVKRDQPVSEEPQKQSI